MENKSYDLTTKEGLNNIADYIKENPTVLIPGPFIHFTTKAINSFYNSKEKSKKQAELAFEIIKNGKKEGLKSMKIIVSEEAGFEISSTLKEFPITTKIGTKGNIELEVEYV
jgi:hypothetical protein